MVILKKNYDYNTALLFKQLLALLYFFNVRMENKIKKNLFVIGCA